MLEIVFAILISTPAQLPEKIAAQLKPAPQYFRVQRDEKQGPPPVQKTTRNRI